jgi:hypothetical protein
MHDSKEGISKNQRFLKFPRPLEKRIKYSIAN